MKVFLGFFNFNKKKGWVFPMEKKNLCPLCKVERNEDGVCPKCGAKKGYPPYIATCKHCENMLYDESGAGAGACGGSCPFKDEE